MNEHVATYIYDPTLTHGVYDIYACYDSEFDKYKRRVSFYDVYDKNGVCVNEGNPFYQFPTWEEVYNTHYMEHVN
jgi:hypothetical protein